MGLKNSSFSLKMKKKKKKKRVKQSYTANHNKRFSPKNVQYPSGKAKFFLHFNTSKSYFIYFNIQLHNTFYIDTLIFPISQILFIFLLISFLPPFSPPLPQNPISDKIIFFFMPSSLRWIASLGSSLSQEGKKKKNCLWLHRY